MQKRPLRRSHFARSFVGFAVVSLTALLFSTTAAQALTINTATSSLDLGIGCSTTPDCFPGFFDAYTLDAPNPPLSGTFERTGLTLTFSVNLPAASFSAVGGSDFGVTSVDFTDVVYSGTVNLVAGAGDLFTFLDEPVSVSGTLTPNGAGAPVAFNLAGVNAVGTCNDPAGPSLTCGIQIGGTGFSVAVNGQTRYFRHTIDIRSVIPEPNTALLLGSGLYLIGMGRRRRQRLD